MNSVCIRFTFAASVLMPAVTPSAVAEVVNSDGGGFEIRIEREIGAPQSRVWQALHKPALWWHPDHTFSGNATNLSLSIPPGGCFCEKLPPNGAVRHMTVIHVHEPGLIRLAGGLGPLQAHPVEGVMDWQLRKSDEKNTTFLLSYRVRGVSGADWAGPVNAVLGQQAGRLERYLEKGDPAAPDDGN